SLYSVARNLPEKFGKVKLAKLVIMVIILAEADDKRSKLVVHVNGSIEILPRNDVQSAGTTKGDNHEHYSKTTGICSFAGGTVHRIAPPCGRSPGNQGNHNAFTVSW
ncbi:MAG TPA: hypothetical protein PKC25_16355, partial [Candidatus Rifleibacterium sp.]|nr:hypothetical protein [Candidatus Rifleibacterium sp.]